jgi:hypothetical protein
MTGSTGRGEGLVKMVNLWELPYKIFIPKDEPAQPPRTRKGAF